MLRSFFLITSAFCLVLGLAYASWAKTMYQCRDLRGRFTLSSEPCGTTSPPGGASPASGLSLGGRPSAPAAPGLSQPRPHSSGAPQGSAATPLTGGPSSAPTPSASPPQDEDPIAPPMPEDHKLARLLSNLANRLTIDGEYDDAITALQGAWRIYPKNPFILLNTAVAYNRRGDWRIAREFYRRAIEFEYRRRAQGGAETRISNPQSPNFGKTLMEVILANWNRGQRKDRLLALIGNPQQGREVYDFTCSRRCHLENGWGTIDGAYPQLAGQHVTVLIKQMIDIAEQNRDNPTMFRFSLPNVVGGDQAVADVIAYIATLPMTRNNGVGPGTDLEHGKRLYDQHCAQCHGRQGEGDAQKYSPRLQGQHYAYMVRQYEMIRDNRRRNAHPLKILQLDDFTDRDIRAVMDFASRLRPDESLLAPVALPGEAEENAGEPTPSLGEEGANAGNGDEAAPALDGGDGLLLGGGDSLL